MEINISKKLKIIFSVIILISLSCLNYYNLKDKAFIKIEKYNIQINNELLAKEFGIRIKLQNLNIKKFKKPSNKYFGNNIKIDTDSSFFIMLSWNENFPKSEINEFKKIILNSYKNSYNEEKYKIQNNFIIWNINLNYQQKNSEFYKEFDRSLMENTTYLREFNQYYYNIQMQDINSYLITNTNLQLIDEIEKVDESIILINKSFEKKEYLIFFALIFNQLIIFLIVILFYKSIPRKF
jgi:hypothetical protein